MIKDIAAGYFINPAKTETFQFVWAFAFGLLGGPLSKGIEYLIIGIVLNEIMIRYITYTVGYIWFPVTRVALACTTFIGWTIGRVIFHDQTGIEHWCSYPQRVRNGECSPWKSNTRENK